MSGSGDRYSGQRPFKGFFEMFVLTLDLAYFTSGQTDRVGRTRPYKGVRSM